MDNQQIYTDILYYIPEDSERRNPANVENPIDSLLNVFTIPGKTVEQVTLNDIIKWFPIPGQYHFRF